MQEESKEEYLARHRKSLGIEEKEDLEPEPGVSFITRIKGWFYLILLLAFVWIIYQMFGMMKSN